MSHNEEIIKKLETEILKDPFKVFRRFYTSLYFPGFAHLKAGLFPKSLLFPVTGMLLIILVIFSFSRQYSIRAVYNSLHKFALYKDSYSTTRPDKDKFIRNLNNDITSFNKALRSGKRARMVLTLEKHVNNILTIFQNEYNQKTAEDNTRLSTIIKELQAVKDNLPAVKKELQAKQKKVRLKYKAKIQQELEKAEESTTKEALGNEVQDLQEQKEKELKQTRFAVHNKYAEAYKTSLAPVLHSYLSSSAFIDLLYEHKQAGFWSLIVFLVLLFLFIGFWAYTVYDFVRLLKFGALNRMLTAVRDGFGFLSLNVLGFLIFIFGPVIFAIYLAFNEWDILTEMLWVGWANFKELFTDPLFWKYLGNTFFFFINVPLGMAASLMLAIALNQRIKGITFFRVLFYLPVVSSIVAVALLWRWIYNPDYGLLNSFLRTLGISNPPAWLNSTTWVKPALAILQIWKGMGYQMLLYLAALQGVPSYLYESAEIDGASRWHRFRYITFPLLGPTHFYCIITGVIGTFQAFGLQYVMTQGGPAGASTTIVYYIYNNAFQWFKMGYAAAISLVLFSMVFVVTLINWRVAGETLYTE